MDNLLNNRKRKACKSKDLAQLQKAMVLIEELCLEHDDMCDEDKQGGVVCQIYSVSHALNGCCEDCPVVKQGMEMLK